MKARDRSARTPGGLTLPVPAPLRGAHLLPTSVWGAALVELLESDDYADDARVGRGYELFRTGGVRQLTVRGGELTARVRGSRGSAYGVQILVPTLTDDDDLRDLVAALCADDEDLAALSGSQVTDAAAARLLDEADDLLGSLGDWEFLCDCPDWGDPCKHGAAVFHAFAHALNERPLALLCLLGGEEGDADAAAAEYRARRPRAGEHTFPTGGAQSAAAAGAEAAPDRRDGVPLIAVPGAGVPAAELFTAYRERAAAGPPALPALPRFKALLRYPDLHTPCEGPATSSSASPSSATGSSAGTAFLAAPGFPPLPQTPDGHSIRATVRGRAPAPDAPALPSAEDLTMLVTATGIEAATVYDALTGQVYGALTDETSGTPADEVSVRPERSPAQPPDPGPGPASGFQAALRTLLPTETPDDRWQDTVRLAAHALIRAAGEDDPTTESEAVAQQRALHCYTRLLSSQDRARTGLSPAVSAWWQAGPAGLACLEQDAVPSANDLARARGTLALLTPAPRPRRSGNRLTLTGTDVQLRWGPDHRWYPYLKEHGIWTAMGQPDPDAARAAAPLLGLPAPRTDGSNVAFPSPDVR